MDAGPATALILSAPTEPARPWPRHVLTPEQWRDMAAALDSEPGLRFAGLWAEEHLIHALLLLQGNAPLLASVPVEAGLYAALSPQRPAAAWFEMAVADLWGHRAANGIDTNPLLDWGTWPVLQPLAARPTPHAGVPDPAEYPPVDQEGQHQATLGPAHGGSGGPAHLRLTCAGEAVVRLDTRLGYGHRGILALMRGKPARTAARLVARVDGGSTVAQSLAFAHAVEAALGMEVPSRAQVLRAVMAETERLSSHLTGIAAIQAAQGQARLSGQVSLLREGVLRFADAAFGHRLMMDRVIPGGVAADLPLDGIDATLRMLRHLEMEWPDIAIRCAEAGAAAHPGAGVIGAAAVLRHDACGVIGKAAGIVRDARIAPGYPPYDTVIVDAQIRNDGEIEARTAVRVAEVTQSIQLIRALVAALPAGSHSVPVPSRAGEGLGVAEAPGGACWCWVRIEAGHVAAAWLRDPAWMHWPLLHHALRGSLVSDFDLIHLSMGLSTAGVDQ